ncbi:cu(2+) suppressing and bleomycin sensitive protein 1 [[Candida] anglica]|uniref:Cu(2+) suppressing and bleomycin sensitive protein 1 n=1 Tax=[Candida] anglica TaxID=148631 RepID=A0ABP0EFU8_9ASCO
MPKQIPSFEKPLHDQLSQIRTSLLALKNNRTKYISSKQVYTIYDEFLAHLHELSLTRKDEELKGMTLSLPNATDSIVDDVWSILSLCFVTCGLTKFAPATYSSLSTVYKLLEHLEVCQVYTMDDLDPIRERLEEIKDIIRQSEQAKEDEDEEIDDSMNNHNKEESLLLRNKWNKCQQLLSNLENCFNEIPNDLEPIYSQLVLMRKQLLNFLTNGSSSKSNSAIITKNTTVSPGQLESKLLQLKDELKEIKQMRNPEGKFPSEAPQSQQLKASIVLNGLLDDCNNFINDLSIQQETPDISNLFKNLSITESDQQADQQVITNYSNLYTQLIDIKLKLENLLVTRRWTMRETDLFNYSKALKEIDDERSSMQESTQSNVQLKKLHMIILYLLRRCYSLIYKLLESSEPVSESLQPIHNQLSTVHRCLLEIKRIDGLNTLKDIYPYQFKLASLDNMRDDGKFIVNGAIPEGQGLLNALLAECFDILHELKIELEEKEEAAGIDEEDEVANITDDEDIQPDDEVELKRNRYMGFHEADYDLDSDSCVSDLESISDSEYEGNDYY